MSNYLVKSKTMKYHTKDRLEFITITKDVQDFIESSGIDNGTVTIQTHHTTFSVWVNEDEKNLIGGENIKNEIPDLKRVLDRFAPLDEDYGHNDVRDVRNPKGKRDTHLCEPDKDGVCHECINAHSHAQGMILQSSISLIVENGKLLLGTWQEIMLIELDHNRERTVTFLVQGVGKE